MAKVSTAKKMYLYDDGTEGAHAKPNTIGMEFRFTEGGMLSIGRTDVGDNCFAAAGWHGLGQKIGDTYAGKSGDEAFEAAAAMIERLGMDEWLLARESAGPRGSMLLAAIAAAKEAASQEFDEASVREKLSDKTYREKVMAVPQVKAQYDRIRAEAAADRAKKSAKVAKGDEGAELGDI